MILQKQLLVTIKLGRIIRICPKKKKNQVQTVRKIINRLKTERELPVFPGVNFLAKKWTRCNMSCFVYFLLHC